MLKYLSSRISHIDNNYVWLTDKRDYYSYIFLGNLVSSLRYVYGKLVSLNGAHFIDGYMSARSEVDGKRPVALRNIGLNCYLNSSFQSIVACTDFVREMRELEHNYGSSKALRIFNKILHSLSDGHNQSSDDVELSSSAILRNWNRSGEQDTFEILSFVVFQVFNELRVIHQQRLPEKDRTVENWIRERLPLKLLIEFRIKCDCGYHFCPRLQSDLALHLSVPFRVYSDNAAFTVERLLDSFFVPEKITDFSCLSPCCTGGVITKSIVLQKPMPNTLCIHVQRTFWNPETGSMEKNNEKISFSETLVVKEHFFTDNRDPPVGPIGSALQDAFLNGDGQDIWWTGDVAPVASPVSYRDDVAALSNVDNGHTSPDLCEVEVYISDKQTPSRHKNSFSTSDDILSVTAKIDDHSTGTIISELARNGDVNSEINGHVNTMYDIGKDGEIEGEKLPTEEYHATHISNDDDIPPQLSEPVVLDHGFDENKEISGCNGHGIDLGNEKDEQVESNDDNQMVYPDFSVENHSFDNRDIPVDGTIGHAYDPQQYTQTTTLESMESEQYHLKSVIVHFGRAESGHYICYRKCGHRWFCTNDNFITEVSFKEVQNSQAYILMYEKSP